MTVLLVRHARAGRRERWPGDDRLRPLSRKGRVQASALVAALTPFLPDAPQLWSSPWVRCVQTLEPLAAALRAGVEGDDTLGEGAGSAAVARLEPWLDSDKCLVACTHGDVVLAVLEDLRGDGLVLDPAGEMPAAKGSTWVLTRRTGRAATARYLLPPG